MNEEFQLILQGPDALIPVSKDKVAVRIMGHLNPSLCDNGSLLPLIGRRFRLGQDLYEIRMTEGVVGFPERMAIMATAIRTDHDDC